MLFHAVCTFTNASKCVHHIQLVAIGTALYQQLQLGGKLLVAL